MTEPLGEHATIRIEKATTTLEGLARDLSKYKRRLQAVVWVLVVDIVLSALISYGTVRDYQFRSCMQTWAGQYTTRSIQLTGPSNDRFNYLFKSAGALLGSLKALTPAQRASMITFLNKQRSDYKLIPTVEVLNADSDASLMSLFDLVQAALSNQDYQNKSTAFPIPEAPTCGALF